MNGNRPLPTRHGKTAFRRFGLKRVLKAALSAAILVNAVWLSTALDPLEQKPVIEAILARDHNSLKRHLVSGSTPDSYALDGTPALVLSIQKGDMAAFEMLVEADAKVNAADSFGKTPLIWSIVEGNRSAFNLLIARQAMIDVADDTGRTPLMYAAERGLRGFAEELLVVGANAGVRDLSGKTAAELARLNGYPRLSEVLSSFE